MRLEALTKQVAYINKNLVGKTIAKAEALLPWLGITIIIYFTDGSRCEIESEWDEGFWFSLLQEGEKGLLSDTTTISSGQS